MLVSRVLPVLACATAVLSHSHAASAHPASSNPPPSSARATPAFTPPFTRPLLVSSTAPVRGPDVTLVHQLLPRFSPPPAGAVTDLSLFTEASAAWVAAFQGKFGSGGDPTGVVGPATGAAILRELRYDGYYPDFGPYGARSGRGGGVGEVPLPEGYKYAVVVPVVANRSVETMASLLDADGRVNMTFRVRTHGVDYPAGSGVQLNQFGPSGATPTGLSMFDLNSPEDDPKDFGPYPVNRATVGMAGNAALLLPTMRNGILLHTGEWDGWKPGDPFPNSHGCIHAAPETIRTIWQTLVSWGVEVRPNTDGVLPYPFYSQGLLAVYEVTR